MARLQTLVLIASSAAAGVLAATTTTSKSSCFTLFGTLDDGTEVNYVSASATATDAGTQMVNFAEDDSAATLLGLDSGRLIDYTDGGKVANLDAGTAFEPLFLDHAASLTDNSVAITCSVGRYNNLLTCQAGDNSTVSVWNWCEDYLVLADEVYTDYGCQAVSLVASTASGCSSSSTSSSSSSSSSSESSSSGGLLSLSVRAPTATTNAVSSANSSSTLTASRLSLIARAIRDDNVYNCQTPQPLLRLPSSLLQP